MTRVIERIDRPAPTAPKLIRVAAYARVSSGKDAMLHSLSAQVSYYNDLIQKHPGWLFCGVYADEALTGTKDTREQFQKLLADCRDGKLDLIVTKSISRFARNTLTLLETVRELKALGVDVYFEEQNIHSLSADGELILTILASYAQEESRSASENQKWRVRQNFQNGIPWNSTMLGYRYEDGALVIHPQEAAVVRQIFDSYLNGKGAVAIANALNAQGIPSRFGNAWSKSSIVRVLNNYTYTGNLLLQTTYRDNHLTKRRQQNNGQLPKYHIEDAHEAIIPLRQFNAVQEEMQRRAERYTPPHIPKNTYPFSGKLVCAGCGKHYRRKVTATGPTWICPTYNTQGKAACPSKRIPEITLMAITAEVLDLETFNPDTFLGKITEVRVENDNCLVFRFTNGKESVKRWQDRSRAESWTEEMKATARRKHQERRSQYENS